jgi:hypothetical protein
VGMNGFWHGSVVLSTSSIVHTNSCIVVNAEHAFGVHLGICVLFFRKNECPVICLYWSSKYRIFG